jgi:subtilisin family serine protease
MRFPQPIRIQRLVSLALIGITLLVMLVPNLPLVHSFAQDAPPPSGDVIVVLKEQPEGTTVAAEAKAATGVQPEQVYSSVIDGYSANVTPDQAQAIANDPQVAGIYPDTPFTAAAQTLPTGVDRIDADTNPSVDINGVDDVRIYTDVAVLDSGIASNTTDLKLMGGTDCTPNGLGYNDDGNGHGTHVAGIIGALDNGRGVVGVAPGARLWSVKVLDDAGSGSMSTLLCGLDWVYANRGTIDLVNMSIEGPGQDGPCNNSPFHQAICNVVNGAGIPVIVAAGNHSTDASQTVPATYSEVITVSAIDDFDGKPGARSTSKRCSLNTSDDTFATISNYGPDVDIAAPGICILSLTPGGGTAYKSGTSMATPHVTGAAAIFLGVNRNATPAQVRAWLLGNAKPQSSAEGFRGDPDGSREPLVWLGGGKAVVSAPYKLVASGASVNSAASTYVRDGKMSTVWKTKLFRSGPPSEAWVWVDLGAARSIGTIRWVFGEYGIGDYFVIEGSNNLSTWSYITKRNGKPVGVWQEKVTNRTYRYVRFRFENPHRDLYLGGLAEVQVWAPGTAPSLPSAGATATPTRTPTPTAATPPNGNYPMYGSSRSSNSTLPKAVWDGDLNTTWQTDGLSVPSSAYVYVTIGSVLPIGTIRWVYGTADIGDDLTIQVSNDKATWTDVHTAGNALVGEWQAVNLTNISGKYIRWFFRNPNNDPVIGGLAEIEVYAPGAFKGEVEPTATPTEPATAGPTQEASPASPEPVLTETPILVETATETATETASPTLDATETPVDLDQIARPESSPVEEQPTETATTEATGPTPYPVVQTSRSASTVSGTFAVDNDPSTVWATDANAHPGRTAHLTLDFGQPVEIGQVRILPGPDGLHGTATIETSNDGKAWSYYADVDPTQVDENGRLTISPAEDVRVPVEARYIRIVFVSPTEGQPLGGISEIEVLPPE